MELFAWRKRIQGYGLTSTVSMTCEGYIQKFNAFKNQIEFFC